MTSLLDCLPEAAILRPRLESHPPLQRIRATGSWQSIWLSGMPQRSFRWLRLSHQVW